MPTKEARLEGWFRQLDNGRLEIFLKYEPVAGVARKIRCSGPHDEMMELVDWFEDKTDLRVDSPTWRRVRKGPRPIEGQMTFTPGELPPDAEVEDDGELP
jgi:hypothetical protein